LIIAAPRVLCALASEVSEAASRIVAKANVTFRIFIGRSSSTLHPLKTADRSDLIKIAGKPLDRDKMSKGERQGHARVTPIAVHDLTMGAIEKRIGLERRAAGDCWRGKAERRHASRMSGMDVREVSETSSARLPKP
jgi:hypothetical protein